MIFSKVLNFLFEYEHKFLSKHVLVTKSNDLHSKIFQKRLKRLHTTIGPGIIVQPGVVIGPNVKIGKNCFIKSGATVSIPGFGSFSSLTGENVHMPHIGGVIIGNHVEIGSLTTICAGTINPTIIENSVHIDDHVHIAHNVTIRASTVITASCTVGGGTRIGERCWIGIGSTLRDRIEICDDVFLGMGSLVTKSLNSAGRYFGSPARKTK